MSSEKMDTWSEWVDPSEHEGNISQSRYRLNHGLCKTLLFSERPNRERLC